MTDDFLRQSQVVTTFGPGSMVDLPDRSVLIEGLQSWRWGGRRDEIEEPRLAAKIRQALALDEVRLVVPPAFEERPGAQTGSIGARIFPTWFLVQEEKKTGPGGRWRRRRLVQWKLDLTRGKFRDDEDGRLKPVVPVRFVCACPRGHLDDLDWWVFTHGKNRSRCGRRMWLEERGTSGDVAETYAGCDCGIDARPLYEALGFETRALGNCRGRRPWLGSHAEEECNYPYRLLTRSASNAYFPQHYRVISLPRDDAAARRLDPVWHILQAVPGLEALRHFRAIPDVARALAGLTDDHAMALIEQRRNGPAPAADQSPKPAEFAVLDVVAGSAGDNGRDSPFYAECLDRDVWDAKRDPRLRKIERVVLVHRLREVIAQIGFTRFESVGADEKGELDLEGVSSANLAVEPRDFPAVESRGEGVLIVLRPSAVGEWLQRRGVADRRKRLQLGLMHWQEEHPEAKRSILPIEYVMLHSLSHLLIGRIALECGYPVASLRERVYALSDEKMFGILLYTGTADAEGTLGGLVEAGKNVGAHLLGALEGARLCSNDPVCAEHDPSTTNDPLRLHGAACHGCLMIAETSCEQRNDWLDRALVVPTVTTPDAAFFDWA